LIKAILPEPVIKPVAPNTFKLATLQLAAVAPAAITSVILAVVKVLVTETRY
jgi:hypothetical protein